MVIPSSKLGATCNDTLQVAPSVAFLHEAARYFERRPTNGEDALHWANVANAETCRKIAALLSSLGRSASQ